MLVAVVQVILSADPVNTGGTTFRGVVVLLEVGNPHSPKPHGKITLYSLLSVDPYGGLISVVLVHRSTTLVQYLALIPSSPFFSRSAMQWSHQGWQAAAVPCGLAVVGVCIILGTAACMYFVLEGRAQAGKEETRLRHRPKFDRSHRDRDQRRSRYDRGSTHVMQEHQTSRREQQDKRGMVEVKINNPSEDGPRLQPQQQQQNEDEHDDDRGWVADSADSVLSRLVAAGSPAQRDQCFRPPCDEVRP